MYQNLETNSATYTFKLYPLNTTFNRIAGIYTFLIIPNSLHTDWDLLSDEYLDSNFYTLLYIGITNNFSKRLKAHHKIDEARALGMTHIGILKKSSTRKRKVIEKDILKNLNPPLNQTWL